jgi:hypothetical protein
MGLEPTTFCVQSWKVPIQSVFSNAVVYQLSWPSALLRRTPRNRFGRPDAPRIDTSLIPPLGRRRRRAESGRRPRYAGDMCITHDDCNRLRLRTAHGRAYTLSARAQFGSEIAAWPVARVDPAAPMIRSSPNRRMTNHVGKVNGWNTTLNALTIRYGDRVTAAS